jgi:hypothetical protein
MSRAGLAITSAALAMSLASCNGTRTTPDETPSPSPSPSPTVATTGTDCAQIASAAEVSAIVGVNVGDPIKAAADPAQLGLPGAEAQACHYAAGDGQVSFSFGKGPDEATVRRLWTDAKDKQRGEDVSGLGDAAYFSAETHNMLSIRGTTFLSVGIVIPTLDPSKERSANLMLSQKVLAKI